MGTKTVLKTESFVVFDNSRFMITEYCKACITALALLIRVSSSSSCLPSFVKTNYPKILELLHLFQWCSTHLQWTLVRVSRMMKYLSFGGADFHPSIVTNITCICKVILCTLETRFSGRKQNQIICEQRTICSFQSWPTRWFDCACLSNSCKLWKVHYAATFQNWWPQLVANWWP